MGRTGEVAPCAVGAEGERAVGAGGPGLRHEGRRAVDVADGQRPGGGKRGVRLAQVYGCRRQHRSVVYGCYVEGEAVWGLINIDPAVGCAAVILHLECEGTI